MLHANQKCTTSCPVCEYQGKETGGQTFNRDNSLLCQNCGAHWRVVPRKTKRTHQLTSNSTSAVKKPFFTYSAPIAFGGLFIAAIYFVTPPALFVSPKIKQFTNAEPLSIGDIIVKNIARTNGKILVVSGEVHNNSLNRLPVPPLLMYWGHKGSSGYIERTYYPALQYLAPGASFKFQTSIGKPVGGAKSVKLKFAGV